LYSYILRQLIRILPSVLPLCDDNGIIIRSMSPEEPTLHLASKTQVDRE